MLREYSSQEAHQHGYTVVQECPVHRTAQAGSAAAAVRHLWCLLRRLFIVNVYVRILLRRLTGDPRRPGAVLRFVRPDLGVVSAPGPLGTAVLVAAVVARPGPLGAAVLVVVAVGVPASLVTRVVGVL